MKKVKLEGKHLFLQFLAMFFVLLILLLAPLFLGQILWFENTKIVITIVSSVIILFFTAISIYRITFKEGREVFLLSVVVSSFLLIYFTTIIFFKSIPFEIEFIITFPLILILLLLFLLLLLKREWVYRDFYFWLIFFFALSLLSRIFFLQSLLKGGGLLEYSYLITTFGYLALLIGGVNDLCQIISKKRKVKKSAKKGKKK